MTRWEWAAVIGSAVAVATALAFAIFWYVVGR